MSPALLRSRPARAATARVRAPRKRPLRKRRAPGPVAASRPHVLLLGTSAAAKRIRGALEEHGVAVRRHEHPDQILESVSDQSRALLVVPPIPDLSVAHHCAAFTERHPHLPVFVALHGTLSRGREQALYDSGVQAVFRWPAERKPLLRTAFRLAGAGPEASKSRREGRDIALEELANGRLQTAPDDAGRGLVARVRHRYAILSGTVDALWKIHLAEQHVADVPGIEEVIGDAVVVEGAGVTDRAIGAAIRQLLKHSTGVDPSTLAVRVDDGRVTFTGTVADRRELTHALRLIGHVRGVKGIENYATVSPRAKHHDRRLARRVREALETQRPRDAIDATVFGHVAVLTGKVPTTAARRAVVELVEGQAGVERVVDKLQITRARP